ASILNSSVYLPRACPSFLLLIFRSPVTELDHSYGVRFSGTRSYLNAYPKGRFAALASARIARLTNDVSASTPNSPFQVSAPSNANIGALQTPSVAPQMAMLSRPTSPLTELPSGVIHRELLPFPGERWIYRLQTKHEGSIPGPKPIERIEFRVDGVSRAGITESAMIVDDGKSVGQTIIASETGFYGRRGAAIPGTEFSPYATAFLDLKPGSSLGVRSRLIEGESERVLLDGKVEGVEDVRTPTGVLRATKVVWQGRLVYLQGGGMHARRTQIEEKHEIWFADNHKRFVRYALSTRVHKEDYSYTSAIVMELEGR
ncbi:MAG: hypothetical protein ACKVQQ_19870, partial [Burkholderiales bacterium]